MTRFEPKSKGRAIDIIKPMLKNSFAPKLSEQMVDPKGPKLALGETDAGRIVADNMEKYLKAQGDFKKLEHQRNILAHRFDGKVFEEYKQRRDKLFQKHRLQKAGRWAIRTAIVVGAVTATVVIMGPGASLIALEPGYEKFASRQRRKEKAAMEQLKKEYKEDSAVSTNGLVEYNPVWLEDKNIQSLQHLDAEGYSLRSGSNSDLSDIGSEVDFKDIESVEVNLGKNC